MTATVLCLPPSWERVTLSRAEILSGSVMTCIWKCATSGTATTEAAILFISATAFLINPQAKHNDKAVLTAIRGERNKNDAWRVKCKNHRIGRLYHDAAWCISWKYQPHESGMRSYVWYTEGQNQKSPWQRVGWIFWENPWNVGTIPKKKCRVNPGFLFVRFVTFLTMVVIFV